MGTGSLLQGDLLRQSLRSCLDYAGSNGEGRRSCCLQHEYSWGEEAGLQCLRVNLDHLPVHHRERAGWVGLDKAMIVGRHEERHALAVQLEKKLVDVIGYGRVEIARGLIGQKDPRVIGDGPSNDDALLLSPRQLMGVPAMPIAEPHAPEGLRHAALDLRSGLAGRVERKGDVLMRGAVGEELKILKDNAEGAAKVRDVVVLDAVGLVVSNLDDPRGGKQIHVEQAEHRGFATPRGPDEVGLLRATDVKRHVLQNGAPLSIRQGEGDGDVVEVDHGRDKEW